MNSVIEDAFRLIDDSGFPQIASCVSEVSVVNGFIRPEFVTAASGSGKIIINKSARHRDVVFSIVKGVASLAWSRMLTPTQRLQWASKMVPAPAQSVRLVASAIASSENFDEALKTLPSAVDKLVGIHVFNALMVGNVGVEVAKRTDLAQLPQVSSFVAGDTPFSLVPLLSVYSNGLEDFDSALAELICDRLAISELSTKSAVESLIKSFFL